MAKSYLDLGYLFSLLGSYFVENDGLKNFDPENLDRGTMERYLTVLDEQLSQKFFPKLIDAPFALRGGINADENMVGIIEQSWGIQTPLYDDTEIRKKMSGYLLTISQWKGTKKALCFMLSQLGFQGCEEQETYFSGGFDSIPFDSPSFDGVEGFFAQYDIALTSSPPVVITPDVFNQIFRIITFNQPAFVQLVRLTHNGVLIFNALGDVETIFKTVKSGTQVVRITSNIEQTILIDYKDTDTQETQTGLLFEFTNTYPDNTEKQFDIVFANETIITALDFSQSELSDNFDIAKFLILESFKATYNKNLLNITLDQLVIFDLDLTILSTGNVLNVTSCPQLEQAVLVANDANVTISNNQNMKKVDVSGVGTLSVDTLAANSTELEFIIRTYSINGFAFFDGVTILNTTILRLLNITFTGATIDLTSFTNAGLIEVRLDDPSQKAFIANTSNLKEFIGINTGAESAYTLDIASIEKLTLSKQTTPASIVSFTVLTDITFIGEKSINIDSCPLLESITAEGANIGSVVGDAISLNNLPNLNALYLQANVLGDFNPGNNAGVIIPVLSNFKNLIAVDLRKCNLSEANIDLIISDILNAEQTAGDEFLNDTGKSLDVSNNTTLSAGLNNAMPTPATIIKIDTLESSYGWTINYS